MKTMELFQFGTLHGELVVNTEDTERGAQWWQFSQELANSSQCALERLKLPFLLEISTQEAEKDPEWTLRISHHELETPDDIFPLVGDEHPLFGVSIVEPYIMIFTPNMLRNCGHYVTVKLLSPGMPTQSGEMKIDTQMELDVQAETTAAFVLLKYMCQLQAKFLDWRVHYIGGPEMRGHQFNSWTDAKLWLENGTGHSK